MSDVDSTPAEQFADLIRVGSIVLEKPGYTVRCGRWGDWIVAPNPDGWPQRPWIAFRSPPRNTPSVLSG